MKINIPSKENKRFDSLNIGDVFCYQDDYFIKLPYAFVSEDEKVFNAFNIVNNTTQFFNFATNVYPVEATLDIG